MASDLGSVIADAILGEIRYVVRAGYEGLLEADKETYRLMLEDIGNVAARAAAGQDMMRAIAHLRGQALNWGWVGSSYMKQYTIEAVERVIAKGLDAVSAALWGWLLIVVKGVMSAP